jgi:hypothetical protein
VGIFFFNIITSINGVSLAVAMPTGTNPSKLASNNILFVGQLKTLKSQTPSAKLSINQYRTKLNQQREQLDKLQQSHQEANKYDSRLENNYSSNTKFKCVKEPESGELIFVNEEENTISQVGRSDKFENLEKARGRLNSLKNSQFSDAKMITSDPDHLWNTRLRDLADLKKEDTRCVNNTPVLNSIKERAKGGQKLGYKFENLLEMSQEEVWFKKLRETRESMFAYAEKHEPEHLQLLGQLGLLKVLDQSFKDNEPIAVKEMSDLTNLLGLDPVCQAPVFTALVKHSFVRFDNLVSILHK